jgi:hypothetical protein
MVLQIGCVAFAGELWGEKWIDPKPLSTAPTIVCGHNLIFFQQKKLLNYILKYNVFSQQDYK